MTSRTNVWARCRSQIRDSNAFKCPRYGANDANVITKFLFIYDYINFCNIFLVFNLHENVRYNGTTYMTNLYDWAEKNLTYIRHDKIEYKYRWNTLWLKNLVRDWASAGEGDQIVRRLPASWEGLCPTFRPRPGSNPTVWHKRGNDYTLIVVIKTW